MRRMWGMGRMWGMCYAYIKRFYKILQVRTCWNLKNLAKTFDEKYKLCKECKVCEECEECEECGECVTHI